MCHLLTLVRRFPGDSRGGWAAHRSSAARYSWCIASQTELRIGHSSLPGSFRADFSCLHVHGPLPFVVKSMDLFKIKSRTRSPTRASGNNESLRRKGDSAGEAVVRLDAAALIGAQQQQQQPLQREVSRSTNVNADGNGSAPVNLLDEKQMGGQGVQLVEFSFPSLLSPPNPAFSTSEARGILIKWVVTLHLY